VDVHRNVAAALSRQNLALFILASQAYLARPRREFFFPPARARIDVEEISKVGAERGTTVTTLVFPVPEMVPDVLYPQLRKSERSLADRLVEEGFRVVGSSSAAEEGIGAILVETQEERLGSIKVNVGPPVGVKEVDRFLEKWTAKEVLQGPYVTTEGRLRVESVEEDRDILSRVKASVPELSLGRDLRIPVEKDGRVLPLSRALDTLAVRAALEGLWKRRLEWLGWK